MCTRIAYGYEILIPARGISMQTFIVAIDREIRFIHLF